MASPAPWLRWTQTELTRWHGQEEEEEEEEEEDDFERRMDEDGVIGLGEGARSPPWGGSEELEEGSPTEEGRWHPRQEPAEDEERGSSGGDEGPLGAESDGDPYPELSSGGCWGSGSSGSPEAMRDGRALCQPRGCSTDRGDTSGLSDTSPSPGTPSRQHRGWGTAGDTIGGHREEWSPRRSLPLQLSTDGPSPECVPEPQTAGTGMAPAGSAPAGQPQGAGSAPAPQGHGRSRVPKKAAPAVVPPKPARQSRSLSPRRRTGAKGTKDPSRTGTEGTQYGRGRLNHPLPDLSKVEARVKFDQSYRPPRGRVLPARPRGPIGFKSPAEIVREVLLSSGEGASPQPPSTAGLPQEFRSPRQATALVQQLQDDYHKLLTKYAEAENTIDQLRLGARVSLFSDPPQPSRSLAVGTVATGSRVMTLSIPQARTAALGMATAPAPPGAAAAPGPSERGGSPQPRSPPPPGGSCPTCPGPCCCPGPRLTRALAGQSRRLQAQVESFESWVRSGTPTASEQLQRMRMLKDAQDALEREYLRGRQQLPAAAGEFDPDRAVEGEIYRLGLRLEGLKERLEPGGRRQPLPQPLPQPCCPPAPSPPPAAHSPCPEVSWGCKGSPSPPPAAHSPCPESPALVEDPRGTAGDSEGVAGGLPWPLWHKQCQVEEDFGDLLEQYKHFKSLPESLSVERLSLAESRSQEEVDAPTAGEGGPSKVPCRTRSLEEERNLDPLALHLPQRRAVTLPPRGPPNLEETRGHHSPATAEEPPASAKSALGVPEPPRVPLSLGGTGSSATQHGPCKEQRIVSPETDSGFVGSEASRVSPPVHTPEHHPPGPGAPGSLGPSVPIPSSLHSPRKRETTPLPSETALMGIYPPGGTGGPRLPPSSPSQSSSPPHWAEGSEVGPDPDGDGTHTDSEVGDRSCASAGGHPPAMARSPTSPLPSLETPSPTLLSPDLPSLDLAHCDLLGSRLERDQAIRALQDEVWRLRRRLEESLLRSRSHPEGKATPRVTRRQPVASAPSAPQDAAPSGEPNPPVRGRAAPGVTPTRRERSASLPRGKPELDLGLELGPSGCHPPSLSSAAASESEPGPRAPPALRKHLGKLPGAVAFRGQCTGTRYQAGTPHATPAPREEPSTSGCPRCHRGRMASGASGGGAPPRQPQHSTPRRMSCPTCRAPTGSRDTATHERVPGGSGPPDPHAGAEKPEQPGIWYLAATPAATVCLAPVPLVPFVPSMLYCSPAVPTSAPALAGVPLGVPAGPRRAERPPRPQGRQRCLSLELEELEELNWCLGRAVEAAQSARLSSSRLSRALATELGRPRGLRGSCLF
ncbi:microtubule organization protein AKNA isoform X2 [Serinus canaria]|uniref:microtubule organization protein AKNA isoform X2 n=1 Tax=Serinus canaria TaxID=9135 RepID=UPI0021CCC297|nr:microtubule organization protein AKNA isoform X2 [Serinus canaria]